MEPTTTPTAQVDAEPDTAGVAGGFLGLKLEPGHRILCGPIDIRLSRRQPTGCRLLIRAPRSMAITREPEPGR
jgi:hypothetical protein